MFNNPPVPQVPPAPIIKIVQLQIAPGITTIMKMTITEKPPKDYSRFNRLKNKCDIETPIASISCVKQLPSERLLVRLSQGFEFYFPTSQKTLAYEKEVIEKCYFEENPAENLLRKIMASLKCNALCAVYMYCSVMHKLQNHTFSDLLNPQWTGPKNIDDISSKILTQCLDFFATDQADLANFVYERFKVSSFTNVDIFKFKGAKKYITQMMETLQLGRNEGDQNYDFALQRLIFIATKVVDIVELFYQRSSQGDKKIPQSDINFMIQKCLTYLELLQPKYNNHESRKITLRKLRNKLHQFRIEQLQASIAESSQSSQILQHKKLSKVEYGDFAFIYNYIFQCHELEKTSNAELQQILLDTYEALDNVQKINANGMFLSKIKQKVELFEKELCKTPEKDANYRTQVLNFLILFKFLGKLDLSSLKSQHKNEQFTGCEQLIQSLHQISEKLMSKEYKINQMFNSLLERMFSFRSLSSPLIMLVMLDVQQNQQQNILSAQNKFISQLFKYYLSQTSKNLNIFHNESSDLHKKLFQNPNLQQIINSDQLYTKCLRKFIEKTIGHVNQQQPNSNSEIINTKSIFDTKNIFIQYASPIVESHPRKSYKDAFSHTLNEVMKLLYRLDQDVAFQMEINEIKQKKQELNTKIISEGPFYDEKMKDINVIYNTQKGHCLKDHGELLKKLWVKIPDFDKNSEIQQKTQSRKDLYKFHQEFIQALDIASDMLDQALLVSDEGLLPDMKIYITMTQYANNNTSKVNQVIKKIDQLVEFFLHMKSLIQSQEKQNQNNKNSFYLSKKQPQDIKFDRKRKVFDQLFTPALLSAIAKYLYFKITMFLNLILDQQLLKKKHPDFSIKQKMSYLNDLGQTNAAENLPIQMIATKLISLVGYMIQTQYKIIPQEINRLVIISMFYITKKWKFRVDDFPALMQILSVLNSIPIEAEYFESMFAQDKDLLKILRYARYVRYVWLIKDLNTLSTEQVNSFSNAMNPKEAAQFTLKYIKELTDFADEKRPKFLSQQQKTNQYNEMIIKCLKTNIEEAIYYSKK